ncbi:MAG TPA: V-type ATP synthase subunit F [Candidatus Limnocylindrales bacterium]|nr:V-type ATP synthase subunit F [Candidatus Limnocylindrales bacterium]
MTKYKIAVIGDKDSILGFKAIGVTTHPVTDADAALSTLKQLVAENYGVIYITEELAQHFSGVITELSKRFLPAVVLIPNSKGALGSGMLQIKHNVEKAIGADILFRKEG